MQSLNLSQCVACCTKFKFKHPHWNSASAKWYYQRLQRVQITTNQTARYIHTHTHMHTHACMHTHMHAHTHTHMQLYLVYMCFMCKLHLHMQELDYHYSPSRWSHRMGPQEVLESHIKTVTNGETSAQSSAVWGGGRYRWVDENDGNWGRKYFSNTVTNKDDESVLHCVCVCVVFFVCLFW